MGAYLVERWRDLPYRLIKVEGPGPANAVEIPDEAAEKFAAARAQYEDALEGLEPYLGNELGI